MSTSHHEDLTFIELQNAITDARRLLDGTEAWAIAWHAGVPAIPPFNVSGIYQAGPLAEVGLRAQAYRAAADHKAEAAAPIWTVVGNEPGDDGESTVRVFTREQDAHEYAQTETRTEQPAWHDNEGRPVYTDQAGTTVTIAACEPDAGYNKGPVRPA